MSRSQSDASETIKYVCDVVVKLLDLSINQKVNLLRSLCEPDGKESEENTIFVSVYDYLHHSSWRVSVSDRITDIELRAVEFIRGNPEKVSHVIELCKLSILKEIDVIHHLNCELFFAKYDAATTKHLHEPSYFYFDKADDFQRAIVDANFTTEAESATNNYTRYGEAYINSYIMG